MEKPKISRSVLMFFITLTSVFLVYGFQWTNGSPLEDSEIAWESAQFAMGLMGILLCHEMGHYIVAKRHGFSLSVPYFLPFPFAFGTLGAVIHLKSLPKTRTALLEMGAAGPIAGFIATLFCFVIDAKNTVNHPKAHLIGSKEEMEQGLIEASRIELEWWEAGLQQIGILPDIQIDSLPLMILSDPLALKGVLSLFLDAPLSPFAELGPLAFAGWVGCMITSINLFPIGQLDGGHIVNALFPKKAERISKIVLFIAIGLSFLWTGWLIWSCLLYFMGATKSISVPEASELRLRSKIIALLTGIIFVLCVMLEPIYFKNVALVDIQWENDIDSDQIEMSPKILPDEVEK